MGLDCVVCNSAVTLFDVYFQSHRLGRISIVHYHGFVSLSPLPRELKAEDLSRGSTGMVHP